jgi:hypothetical protein
MDFEKLYMGQKTHDKMELGFLDAKFSLVSKHIESPKEGEKDSLKSENKRKKYEKYKR